MKLFFNFIYITLFLGIISCSNTEQADLIIHNAKIYTVNDLFDIAEAMVITDGKIVAIGPEHEIRNKYNATKTIDAKKQTIYPGFIDAHCHFVGYALNLKKVNLVGTTSFDDVIKRVIDFSKNNSDEWIIGRGWDQNDWDIKEFPTKEKLDSLFPTRPVFLTRIDGHAAIANAEALRRANITSITKVEGGIITFNIKKNGETITIDHNINVSETSFQNKYQPEPTGILLDNALGLIHKVIPQPTILDIEVALLNAQHNLFAVGITTVDDAGLSKDTINLIDQLQQDGKLKMKVYAMISGNENMLNYYLEKGPYKTEMLTVNSFKFYADGALGSRGACLLQPYSDIIENEHYGLLINEADFFNKYAPLLYEKGFQMNTHCIGDSANRLILDVYAKVLKGVNDKRWRIEHAQVIHSNDFEKFRDYTIIPSVQSTHATSDMYWAKDRLGKERVKTAYAYKDLLNQNGIIALGTDFPVEDISPIKTFYAAIARKDSKGYPENGYQMENALTREEALKGMTIWAAIANFEENEKGSLEVGKSADFVLLNNDIMTTSEENILKVKVVQTFINGENVFTIKK
ncbi:MAG: amidohydrolase [Flavobacteriales bacterium]|nr:amidohydrolase [Flavobacteriales bacterium]